MRQRFLFPLKAANLDGQQRWTICAPTRCTPIRLSCRMDATSFIRSRSEKENGGIYVGALDQADSTVRLLPEISSTEYAPLSGTDPRLVTWCSREVVS